MVTPEVAAELARQWDEGWNNGDLDVVMAPFADNVVFSSTFSQRDIVGHDALREYCQAALVRAGDVRYKLHKAYTGTETVVLVYTCYLPGGVEKPGADLMRVDADGKVVEWRCHYTSDPTRWRS